MRPEETLHQPKDEARDDTTRVVENGGYIHLAGAAEDDELYFKNGEDSDGDPNNPANPNSRAYNPLLEDTDEPLVDGFGDIQQTSLDQFADIQPDSEKPFTEK